MKSIRDKLIDFGWKKTITFGNDLEVYVRNNQTIYYDAKEERILSIINGYMFQVEWDYINKQLEKIEDNKKRK